MSDGLLPEVADALGMDTTLVPGGDAWVVHWVPVSGTEQLAAFKVPELSAIDQIEASIRRLCNAAPKNDENPSQPEG